MFTMSYSNFPSLFICDISGALDCNTSTNNAQNILEVFNNYRIICKAF